MGVSFIDFFQSNPPFNVPEELILREIMGEFLYKVNNSLLKQSVISSCQLYLVADFQVGF